MKPLNYIAAPILAQRNIELSQIFTHYDELALATVYTVHTAEGKIGFFSVSTRTLAHAVHQGNVEALLTPLFEAMEFSDGKPVVPAIEPAQPPAEAGSGESGEAPETVNADGAASATADSSGSPETPAEPEGQEQGTGPAVEQTGEHGPE